MRPRSDWEENYCRHLWWNGKTLPAGVHFQEDIGIPSKADRCPHVYGSITLQRISYLRDWRQVWSTVAYVIGVAEPVLSWLIHCNLGELEEKIATANRQIFDAKPSGIIRTLDLKRPI